MSESIRQTDQLCINTIRMLAADAVEKAKSGHPGLPLGAAPMAYVLWTKFLRHNPGNPFWPNRDRFVLSAGHGSALLYAMLHLTGYDLSLDDIKSFRQWGSKTPGHPEYDLSMGVEATTGPLGQGFGMGVGMALAERFLAACFNRPEFPVMDHFTYAIVSDGDLMEGISSEAASLAGHLRLGKLIYLYDDNHISIEGNTALTFTEDVCGRFEAYHWHVQKVSDGNDLQSIEDAIEAARQEVERPSLIAVRTHIGYGSPKQDSASAHGEALGEDALRATKENFGWPQDQPFYVPAEALSHMRLAVEEGRRLEESWRAQFEDYRKSHQSEGDSFDRQFNGKLPQDWDSGIPTFTPEDGPMATRAASGKVLNSIAQRVEYLLGGSADLAPSTKTMIAGSDDQGYENHGGRNIHFGVREHGMGAIVNGMALHGGVIPYGATFLIFSDYMRPALRLSALMNTHSIFVFTHDSIGVGEDGPTHQPIEHLSSLRAMPNFTLIRPADANETAAAWRVALERRKPVAMALTRQKLPVFDPSRFGSGEGVAKGAYVLSDVDGSPDMLIIATGSEVHLALEAQEKLAREHNINARVISMPCWEIFQDQPKEYQDEVLPPAVKKRIAVEAACSLGWSRWVGDQGSVIGIDHFGASAPGSQVFSHFGFTADNIVARAQAMMKG
ncbi:MAG: transketolase [Deltaproteobacteria bacterium]